MQLSSSIVQTSDLTVRFGGVGVVDRVSIRVDQGETLAVVGPNGAGKTSMFRAVLGLLPYSGEALLFGRGPSARRYVLPFVGYVPQHIEFEPTFPATVADVVLMGLTASQKSKRGLDMIREGGFEYAPPPDGSRRRRLDRVLEAVRLAKKRNHRVASLSGGERQRVFIAQALIKDPLLMICDEPVSSADAESQEAFYSTMEEAGDQYGITVILSLHDLDMVRKHSNRVAYINRTLMFHGDTEAFFRGDKYTSMYAEATMHEARHARG